MNTLQKIAQAMLDSDIDQGHASPDTQWGRYEMLAAVAINKLHDLGLIKRGALSSILEGKS